MLSLPVQFIIATIAYAINERMARRNDYFMAVSVLREAYAETELKLCCQTVRPNTNAGEGRIC